MLSFVIQIIIYFRMLVIFCTVLPQVSEWTGLPVPYLPTFSILHNHWDHGW